MKTDDELLARLQKEAEEKYPLKSHEEITLRAQWEQTVLREQNASMRSQRKAYVKGALSREAEVESLTKELTALREANRWIRVSERLPKQGVYVFVYDSSANIKGEEIRRSYYTINADWSGITHWRPLPAPPETDKQ